MGGGHPDMCRGCAKLVRGGGGGAPAQFSQNIGGLERM